MTMTKAEMIETIKRDMAFRQQAQEKLLADFKKQVADATTMDYAMTIARDMLRNASDIEAHLHEGRLQLAALEALD